MGNQFEFDPMAGGPQITGTWFNRKTGKTINVRDAFIGDSGMQIMTSTGELIDMNDFSDNYIQCDNTIYDENGKSTGKKEEVDYEAMFAEATSSLQQAPIITEEPKNTTGVDTNKNIGNLNTEIIKKMFSNFKTTPKLVTSINWKDMPSMEIITAMKLLDISIDDLSEYIFNNFSNNESIKESIKDALNNILDLD